MTKLNYINEQQFVADAAQALIKAHLRWSGSDRDMPSKDLDNICGQMIDAYLEANYTVEKWRELTDDRREVIIGFIREVLFEDAKKLADSKWAAAMLLLGI